MTEDRDAQMMRQIADGLAMIVSAIRARHGANEIRYVKPIEQEKEQENEQPVSPFIRRVANDFGVDPDVVTSLAGYEGGIPRG